MTFYLWGGDESAGRCCMKETTIMGYTPAGNLQGNLPQSTVKFYDLKKVP